LYPRRCHWATLFCRTLRTHHAVRRLKLKQKQNRYALKYLASKRLVCSTREDMLSSNFRILYSPKSFLIETMGSKLTWVSCESGFCSSFVLMLRDNSRFVHYRNDLLFQSSGARIYSSACAMHGKLPSWGYWVRLPAPPNTAWWVLKSHHLLAGASPVVITARRPINRQIRLYTE
jgi:hypothetical protein